MPNVSADIDTFLRSADNAAARTNLGVLPLSGGTLTGPLTITGGTATDSTPLLIMSQTWNDGTEAFKFDTKSLTNTASKAYSSTWADVSTVNEIQVGGVAKFAFIPVGSEGNPMLALGRENDLLLKAASYALIIRSEATSDMVAIGWCNNAPGVTVGQNGRIGFNDSALHLGGGNAAPDAFIKRGGAANALQMGSDHATTATHQTFKAHNVTTGNAANLILKGGTSGGGGNNGNVNLEGGSILATADADIDLIAGNTLSLIATGNITFNSANRAAYSENTGDIAAALVAFGIMAPA